MAYKIKLPKKHPIGSKLLSDGFEVTMFWKSLRNMTDEIKLLKRWGEVEVETGTVNETEKPKDTVIKPPEQKTEPKKPVKRKKNKGK